MGITYRQSHQGRLSIQEMDNNFHYIEEQLAGLTSSKTDRLISPHQSKGGNDLEVVLDNKGTLNTPLLLPTEIWTATCDSNHFIDPPKMIGMNYNYVLDNTMAWEFEVKFEVSQNGIVETQINNPFPIETNPGYVSGNSFRFTEADHGIPDFIFDIVLNDVDNPDDTGWTANIAVTQAPEYPSTIKSLGAVKITANDKNLILGIDGSLTFPDNSVQTTAYTSTPYRVFSANIVQTGENNPPYLLYPAQENTIGISPTFSYNSPGIYYMEFPDLFPVAEGANKILVYSNNMNYRSLTTICSGFPGTSTFTINTQYSFTSNFFTQGDYADSLLSCCIEIRVYD